MSIHADLHFKDRLGCITLHLATLNQSKHTVDVMKILVDDESNVNATDEKGRTPLYYVADQNTEWRRVNRVNRRVSFGSWR